MFENSVTPHFLRTTVINLPRIEIFSAKYYLSTKYKITRIARENATLSCFSFWEDYQHLRIVKYKLNNNVGLRYLAYQLKIHIQYVYPN